MPRGRFLERIRRWIPGVEIVAEATISHETDLYLPEHVFEGTPLFPSVMAIEAMVEAAIACVGGNDLPVIRNIQFRRPLIVPEDAKITMRMLALADEIKESTVCVRVAIRSDVDNFREDHFSAECVFGLETLGETELPRLSHIPEPLPQSPEDFSPVPLFQGKLFRRINAIRILEMSKESLTEVQVPDGERYYSKPYEQFVVAPSPAVQDAFLQSAALIIPPGCLPESIQEIRFHRPLSSGARLFCHVLVSERADGAFLAECSVFTPTGELIETIRGCVLRVPKVGERVIVKPAATPIPLSRLGSDLQALLPKVPHAISVIDHVELQNLSDVNEITQEEVEQIRGNIPALRQQSVIANLVATRRAALDFARRYSNLELSPARISLAYRPDGKPELQFADASGSHAFAGIDVSLADGAGISVALIGPAPVGVDIEIVETRDAETWRGLLGDDGYAEALHLASETAESFDCAAIRVWTLLEAGKKANALKRIVPRYEASLGGPWLSCTESRGDFLCTTVESPHVPKVALALTMGPPANDLPDTERGYKGRTLIRVYRFHSFDLAQLKQENVPMVYAGPNEVLIEVKAVSPNYRDLLIVKGLYDPQLRLPAIPLSDGAGIISAIGGGVKGLSVVDCVVTHGIFDWKDGPFRSDFHKTSLGSGGPGLAAEQVVLPAHAVLPIPGDYDFVQAATLPVAALTAWSALVTEGRLTRGQTLLTLGTGGVSIFALQLAKAFGAKVIITSSNDAKLELARQLGADYTINYRTHPKWESVVLELTSGKGADVTVETGGIRTLEKSIEATRAGGTIAVLGTLTGIKGAFNTEPIIMKRIRLAGVYVGSREEFEAMNRFLIQASIKPVVDQIFSFETLPEALRYMESGRHFGKIVVQV